MTSIPRSFATATSATLVVPQSTVTMTLASGRDGRLDRGERQPVALVEPARDIGHDGHAEPAQGDGHDREAGQAVGIEIAEDEDPLGPVARGAQPGEEPVRIGQAGSGRGGRPSGSREPGRDVVGRSLRPGWRGGRSSGPRCRARPRRRLPSATRSRGSGRSSESGVRPRRQDATEGCTADLPAGCVARLRPRCAGPAGLRVVVRRPWRRSSHRCQSTSSGLATKIEE